MTSTTRIAHVLFVDIVGFSLESTAEQSRRVEQLNAAVNASPAYLDARANSAVHHIHTGDGIALAFFNDVLAPVQTAVDVAKAISATLPVRMGVHSGLVLPQMDAVGRENLVGEGLNTAQRVMDFGDAGHILLSAQYAAWLQHFDEWTPLIHPLGEGTAKHNLVISVFSLRGAGFGESRAPQKLESPAKSPAAEGKKVALLYRSNLEPDGKVLKTLETRLKSLGHEVFVDNHQKISAAWAKAIEDPIRSSDAVVAIVSPQSLRSEMLEYEIETAQDQFVRTGKPVILPVRVGGDDGLEGNAAAILKPLHFFAWAGPEDDERLVTELLSAITEPLKPRTEEGRLEPVGGAVPPDSPFYVRRECDADLAQALDAQESILLVKGARQIGKTSLLAQGTKRSRETGRRVAVTDFQKFNAAQMNSDETFYRLMAATLARQLAFKYDFESNWDDIFGANLNMENFLREVLDSTAEPLVWYMDEVDKLFTAPFASDFFGLVRSWHNSRSTEPAGPWGKLTVVIAYATEAHLFIQDLNQSPFNVGRKLQLDDFNLQQTIDLNARYGSPLSSYGETESLFALIGGQPFLTRAALDVLAKGRETHASLLKNADRDDGPFNDHLKRILISVSRLPEVAEFARSVLEGKAQPQHDEYYRLAAAGIVRQDGDGKVVFRCELYRSYLNRLLVD
ncbi:MAG: AAA-like domain-containing protein [Fimbriimonadaceae bacterium]|nr:AAA-like domain-containing protein [Fimbriimonadaceae bacterium]